jgi:hypothetical protein
MDKHIPYFELSEACARPQCPLCSIVADRAAKYLDNLLFEHITDRPFRAAFRAAGGFCPEHAGDLAGYRDGLAVAILYRDILEDGLEGARKGREAKPKAPCPICAERGRIEDEYLGFLAESGGAGQEETEFRQAFERGRGLCLPHFMALRRRYRATPQWLIDFQIQRLERLLLRTDRFIELSAYGHQDEFEALSPDDKVVWKETIDTARKRP